MGIEPITISSVEATPEGGIKIHGQNFTRYSKVYVNDKACTTWYSSAMTLEVEAIELEPGDEVTVWQKSLSCTEPYIYERELMNQEMEVHGAPDGYEREGKE